MAVDNDLKHGIISEAGWWDKDGNRTRHRANTRTARDTDCDTQRASEGVDPYFKAGNHTCGEATDTGISHGQAERANERKDCNTMQFAV